MFGGWSTQRRRTRVSATTSSGWCTEEASPEWGLSLWLSAVTGARRGEVVALQWQDIDFAKKVMRLDENYVRTDAGMLLRAFSCQSSRGG